MDRSRFEIPSWAKAEQIEICFPEIEPWRYQHSALWLLAEKAKRI